MRSGGRHTAGQKGQKPRHRQFRALRSYIASGQSGDYAVTLLADGVSGSREVPGRIRNTARFAGGVWHEVGEFSHDGTTWVPIMEMRLRKQD